MKGFLLVMLAGFAGSFHCIGMCGGFVCGLGPDPSGRPMATAVRHVLYNLGRLITYGFIGALAGLLGAAVIGHGGGHGVGGASGTGLLQSHLHGVGYFLAGPLGAAQRALSVAAGLLMLVMALQLFGFAPHFPRTWSAVGGNTLVPALRALLSSRNHAASIALGVLNGFLPCPLVYGFAALAAAAGAPEPAMLIMLALGLGTLPAMLLMGAIGRLLAPSWRRRGVHVAGFLVLAFGLTTIVRGLAPSVIQFPGHSA